MGTDSRGSREGASGMALPNQSAFDGDLNMAYVITGPPLPLHRACSGDPRLSNNIKVWIALVSKCAQRSS